MFPTYRSILCCHGLGAQAPEVLSHAFRLARCCDAQVTVAHAVEPISPQIQSMLEFHLPADRLLRLREAARQRVAEELSGQVQALPEGAGSAHLRGIRVVEGHPSEVLLEVAREEAVDLVVMGTHRHSAVGELLLGSTAHRVAQRSRVPVLLVPLAG